MSRTLEFNPRHGSGMIAGTGDWGDAFIAWHGTDPTAHLLRARSICCCTWPVEIIMCGGGAQPIRLLSDEVRLLLPFRNGHRRISSLPGRHKTPLMAQHERRIPGNPNVLAAPLPKQGIVIVCELQVLQTRRLLQRSSGLATTSGS